MSIYRNLLNIYHKTQYYVRIALGKELLNSPGIRVKKKLLGDYQAEWCIATEYLDKDSIIYSIGVGTDISFDLQLIQEFQCNVFAFDPTPRSIEWIQKKTLPEKFHFYDYGIAGKDGTIVFYPPANPNFVSFSSVINSSQTTGVELPVFRIKTVMSKLGHSKIDLLKMDIEGSEYEVIDDLINSGLDIKQIQVEFHHRFDKSNIEKTRKAIKLLKENQYKIFYVSPVGEEYSFIKVESN